MKNKRRLLGVLFILLTISIAGVSAYIYELATQTVIQTILEIATLTVQNSALGSIEEGETKTYTKTEVPSLEDAISVVTTKNNVYLHLDGDLDTNGTLSTYYSTYNITVVYDTVPGGSGHVSGTAAATLLLGQADPSSIDLDISGTWTFDLEITTTAKSVNSNTDTTVTIKVTAESTS